MHPALTARLRPWRAEHVAHEQRLRAALPGPVPERSGAAGPSGRSRIRVPARPAAALAALRSAEAAAAQVRGRDALAVRAADTARLLAVIGGCEAAHAALLTS